MYIIKRIKLLTELLFKKNPKFSINGVEISITEKGDLKIEVERFLEINSAVSFINCKDSSAIGEVKAKYMSNPEEFIKVAVPKPPKEAIGESAAQEFVVKQVAKHTLNVKNK